MFRKRFQRHFVECVIISSVVSVRDDEFYCYYILYFQVLFLIPKQKVSTKTYFRKLNGIYVLFKFN